MKKLFKRYGATVLFYLGILAIFFVGVFVGMYGKSAPDAETANFYKDNITSETASVAEVETQTDSTADQITSEAAPQRTEITVTATAYCPCAKCCGKTDGITATGTKATAGRTIAVDPSVIPYGTEIIINGNTYVAEDCGGAVKGNKIDVYFDTHEEALEWGKRQVVATIAK